MGYIPPPVGDVDLPLERKPEIPRLMLDPMFGPMFKRILVECFNDLTIGGTIDPLSGKRVDDVPLDPVRLSPNGRYYHNDVLKRLGFDGKHHQQTVEDLRIFKYIRKGLRLDDYLGWEFKVICVNEAMLKGFAEDANGRVIYDAKGQPRLIEDDWELRPEVYLAGIGHGTRAIGAVAPSFANGAFLTAKRDHEQKKLVGTAVRQVSFRKDEAQRLGFAPTGRMRIKHQ